MGADRFDRFLPLAGVLAGLLFFVGLALNRSDPSSETGPAETFAYWQADRGQHQIVGLLVAPLIAFLLLFFGAGLKRRLEQGSGGSGHGSVAFGGAILASATFTVVAMLEGAMTNAAHEGERQAVYTINQIHSYDWLGWNAAFAAMLLATGLGALREPDAAEAAGLDHDPDRCLTPDAARVLRVHPPAGVADRGRAPPRPGRQRGASPAAAAS